MSDLDDLAGAAGKLPKAYPVTVRSHRELTPADALAEMSGGPVSIHVHSSSPSSHTYHPPRRDHSPFAWGFMVTLGVLAALFAVFLGLYLTGSAATELERQQKRTEQQRLEERQYDDAQKRERQRFIDRNGYAPAG